MVLPSATKHQVVTATVCSILLSAIIWLCGQRYFVEPLVRQVDAFRRERPPVLHTVQLADPAWQAAAFYTKGALKQCVLQAITVPGVALHQLQFTQVSQKSGWQPVSVQLSMTGNFKRLMVVLTRLTNMHHVFVFKQLTLQRASRHLELKLVLVFSWVRVS